MVYQNIKISREFFHFCACFFLAIFGLIVNFHFFLDMHSQYSICRQGKGCLSVCQSNIMFEVQVKVK